MLLSSAKKFFSSNSNSNESCHLGICLYYVSKIVASNPNNGSLNMLTELYWLSSSNKTTSIKRCGFWKGAIPELNFCTSNVKSLNEIINN